ncbi:MAG: DUF983 domain-containing protein [Verrucomicrobiota bacterium]|nr:DUF983 domain-containing protein [Verrucomicrobiota bacterium]
MPVTRQQIMERGLHHSCPNCGAKPLFSSRFKMYVQCPKCGMNFDKEDGFYAGYLAILYGMVAFGWIAPIALLWLLGVLGNTAAIILGALGAVAGPVLLYQTARCIWMAGYYWFLPHELPANMPEREGENVENRDGE